MTKSIAEDLNEIKKVLAKLQKSIPDKDMFLTAEESLLVQQSYANEKERKLIPASEVDKIL